MLRKIRVVPFDNFKLHRNSKNTFQRLFKNKKWIKISYRNTKVPRVYKKTSQISRRLIIKKLICLIIKKGKKNKAYNIFLQILLKIKLITKKSPMIIILLGLTNLKPFVEVIKVRKAGKIYEVPVPLKKKKQLFLILNWLVTGAWIRKNITFANALVLEIFDNFFKRGYSVKNKQSAVKRVHINRAITHFRWR